MENYPLYVYLFDSQGCYSAPIKITNELQLKCQMQFVIKRHVENKLKVIITDVEDNCVFHSEQGKILFPT